MSRLCKHCNSPEDDHPFRHPFEPKLFNMPTVTKKTNWDLRFINLAGHFAGWSKDPSTQVGAVIVDDKRRVLAHGYNGFPRGVEDSPERYEDREQKYPRAVHAEMNAILNTGTPWQLEGAVLYSTMTPCCECAKAIIQVGIKRVMIPIQRAAVTEAGKRWEKSFDVTYSMFKEAGVEILQVY